MTTASPHAHARARIHSQQSHSEDNEVINCVANYEARVRRGDGDDDAGDDDGDDREVNACLLQKAHKNSNNNGRSECVDDDGSDDDDERTCSSTTQRYDTNKMANKIDTGESKAGVSGVCGNVTVWVCACVYVCVCVFVCVCVSE